MTDNEDRAADVARIEEILLQLHAASVCYSRPLDEAIGPLWSHLVPLGGVMADLDEYQIDECFRHLRSFVFPIGEFAIKISTYAVNCVNGFHYSGFFSFGRRDDQFRIPKTLIGLGAEDYPDHGSQSTFLEGRLAWKYDISPDAPTLGLGNIQLPTFGQLVDSDHLIILIESLIRHKDELPRLFPL